MMLSDLAPALVAGVAGGGLYLYIRYLRHQLVKARALEKAQQAKAPARR